MADFRVVTRRGGIATGAISNFGKMHTTSKQALNELNSNPSNIPLTRMGSIKLQRREKVDTEWITIGSAIGGDNLGKLLQLMAVHDLTPSRALRTEVQKRSKIPQTDIRQTGKLSQAKLDKA